MSRFPLYIEKEIYVEKEIWFSPANFAGVFKLDPYTKKIRFVSRIIDIEHIFHGHRYFCAAKNNESIFFAPKFERDVKIYNSETGRFKSLPLDIPEVTEMEKGNGICFRSAVIKGNVLWILPMACHKIIEINMSTYEYKVHTEWFRRFEQFGWKNKGLFRFAVAVNDSIWFPCTNINALVEFSMLSKESIVHYIGSQNMSIARICIIDGSFWLLVDKAWELLQWDQNNRIIRRVKVPDSFGRAEGAYMGMISIGEKLFFMPGERDGFYVYDTRNDQWKELEEKYYGMGGYIDGCVFDETKIFAGSQINGEFVIYDSCTDNIELYDVMGTNDFISHELLFSNSDFDIKKNRMPYYENDDVSLNALLLNSSSSDCFECNLKNKVAFIDLDTSEKCI